MMGSSVCTVLIRFLLSKTTATVLLRMTLEQVSKNLLNSTNILHLVNAKANTENNYDVTD